MITYKMDKYIASIMLVIMMMAIFTGCMEPKTLIYKSTNICRRMPSSDEIAFHRILSALCEQELWSSRDCYDTCGWLMIPMHYAFKSGDAKAIKYFEGFFKKFLAYYRGSGKSEFNEFGRISELQFLYFCSQYLKLCIQYGFEEMYIPDLADVVLEEATHVLYKSQATWKIEPTVEEHILQVLNGKQYDKRYYSCITDGDMYSLAIICDVAFIFRNINGKIRDEMSHAASLAYAIFSNDTLNTLTDEGGWLFQVGIFYDYPEYLYAGNTEIFADMPENKREDITWDVSHFQRMPLFLTSYENAQETEFTKDLFRERKKQLSNQLKKCIVKVGEDWLQTTFMDGSNGVYKYNANTGRGICGYNNSAPLIQGWWALIYDDWMFRVYAEILDRFPCLSNVDNPYWDHITTREQNPYFDCDTAWDLGWYYYVVKCAVYLGEYKT